MAPDWVEVLWQGQYSHIVKTYESLWYIFFYYFYINAWFDVWEAFSKSDTDGSCLYQGNRSYGGPDMTKYIHLNAADL